MELYIQQTEQYKFIQRVKNVLDNCSKIAEKFDPYVCRQPHIIVADSRYDSVIYHTYTERGIANNIVHDLNDEYVGNHSRMYKSDNSENIAVLYSRNSTDYRCSERQNITIPPIEYYTEEVLFQLDTIDKSNEESSKLLFSILNAMNFQQFAADSMSIRNLEDILHEHHGFSLPEGVR